MQMKLLVTLLAFILPVTFGSAFAATNSNEIGVSSWLAKRGNTNAYNPEGYWMFGGASTGYVTSSADRSEYGGSGPQLAFKGLVSFYSRMYRMVLDGGMGVQLSRLSDNNVSAGADVFFLDLVGRYRINQTWQVGPFVNPTFGGNAGYSGGESDKDGFAMLVGASGIYEMVLNQQYPLRFEGRIGTDLSIVNRQIFFAQLGLQLGFPIGQRSSAQVYTDSISTRTSGTVSEGDVFADVDRYADRPVNPISTVTNKPAPKPVQREMTLERRGQSDRKPAIVKNKTRVRTQKMQNAIAVKIDDVKFRPSSVLISERDRRFFNALGQRLKDESRNFDVVEIRGFADAQGSRQFNTLLSQSRAKIVGQALQETDGLNKRQIKYSTIRTSDIGDRKVEVIFHGVRDVEKLNEVLTSLQ